VPFGPYRISVGLREHVMGVLSFAWILRPSRSTR
jgi:hypothetical protein